MRKKKYNVVIVYSVLNWVWLAFQRNMQYPSDNHIIHEMARARANTSNERSH